jgi:hypothetical protein
MDGKGRDGTRRAIRSAPLPSLYLRRGRKVIIRLNVTSQRDAVKCHDGRPSPNSSNFLKTLIAIWLLLAAAFSPAQEMSIGITNNVVSVAFNAPEEGTYGVAQTTNLSVWPAGYPILLTNGWNSIGLFQGYSASFFRVAKIPDIAPATIVDTIFNVTVTNGSGQFAQSGRYVFMTSGVANTYWILGPGNKLSHGTYTYTRLDHLTAELKFDDSQLGPDNTGMIYFDNPSTSGSIYLQTKSGTSTQLGSFAPLPIMSDAPTQ